MASWNPHPSTGGALIPHGEGCGGDSLKSQVVVSTMKINKMGQGYLKMGRKKLF